MTNKVSYKFDNKHNTSYDSVTKVTCRFCLERTTLRVISVEEEHAGTGKLQKVNKVACTRCLKSCRYNKKHKLIQHPIVFVLHMTWKHKLRRKYLRTKRYFTGDHIRRPFGRKRTK